MRRLESIIQNTKLQWSFFRPGRLLSGASGKDIVFGEGFDLPKPNASRNVYRRDLAAFILERINDESTFSKGFAIATL